MQQSLLNHAVPCYDATDQHSLAGALHCCGACHTGDAGLTGCSPSLALNAAEHCPEKLRLQLASVGEKFQGFKTSIAEDSRKKRLIEEQKYNQLYEAIEALEKAIAAEKQKRGEANKALERAAGKMATEMLQRLQAKVGKHIGHLTGALDHLINRCEELERGIAAFKGEQATHLSRQFAELMARCKAARAAFEAEVRARNEREEVAGEKLQELLGNLDRKIDSEILARHQQVAALKRGVKILLRGDEPHEQFQIFVKEELEELHGGLAAARRAREEADDEILEAINEYTGVLQRGLQSLGRPLSNTARV